MAQVRASEQLATFCRDKQANRSLVIPPSDAHWCAIRRERTRPLRLAEHGNKENLALTPALPMWAQGTGATFNYERSNNV